MIGFSREGLLRDSLVQRNLRYVAFVLVLLATRMYTAHSQPTEFVTRSHDTLKLNNRPFYFFGVNAYYLLEQSARGDTATVKHVMATANAIGATVLRTWGFFDASDSVDPAVIQYGPGLFNERAMRALDYVIFQARLHNIRVLIPLVNNWDDYGGMNQYVRWRSQITYAAVGSSEQRYSNNDLQRIVRGGGGRTYQYALTSRLGHDDFYADTIIRGWYKSYISTILNRMNTFTHVQYKDEPAILGWELANEPRSSDISTFLVQGWIREMASFLKTVDSNHLLGTGEEGFDVTTKGFSVPFYNGQAWLFDGSHGVAFSTNSMIPAIDFCSSHLYPDMWNLPSGVGNIWIRDHARIAQSIGKPMIVGEFGSRAQKSAVYASWLSTALFDGASGALVWQLLEGTRTDDGFGIRCGEEITLCTDLRKAADRFRQKSEQGSLPAPAALQLRQNFPNPFNSVTTISYSLPFNAQVNLAVFNSIGQRVRVIVEGMQSVGERSELLDGEFLASGSYFYRLEILNLETRHNNKSVAAKKLILIR